MRRRITLVSTDAGPGHNCGLALGLQKYGHVSVVWENHSPHKIALDVPSVRYGYKHINRGDDIIIVGCLAYNRIFSNVHRRAKIRNNFSRIHVIITDGLFARDPDKYNHLFRTYDVITNGCKRHFRGNLKTKTFYQPFDLSHIDQTKNNELTISHSPFGLMKFREKGTEQIIEASKGHNFDLITKVSWDKCLKRKAKSHIFVDQVDHYDRSKFKFRSKDYVWPALGKSGIEAMHLGCCVITHGKGYDTDIPAPTVAWCNGNFREVLAYYISNKTEREKLAASQKAWALKYASYDFAAQQVLK